jgi:hypothetical protein
MRIDIPEDADEAEAAAITAVLRTVAAEAELAAESSSEPSRDRWRFAGRIDGLQGRRVRMPSAAPSDDWRAAGRTDRF